MATRKRSASKTSQQQQPPPRACIACTELESEVQLIQPCRTCAMDYCTGCLASMFEDAVTDSTRMPPRCCNLIQIHTILGSGLLSDEQAKAYREKFEEWITPAKTYCPSPTCSAFIPDRKVPHTSFASSTGSEIPSLNSFLGQVLEEITKSSQARFFRADIDASNLPRYNQIVTTPMDLSIIRKRLLSSHYKKTDDLTSDMRLIVTNARDYNGDKHPITRTAVQFLDRYHEEVSKAIDRLISSSSGTGAETMFACPTCHIAICTSCKQIEHTGAPCDTSARDHELAMLETFGYKRCPRCKAGVKKMFGCSHIQCVCGAHWCYYCQRSIELCDGACDARIDEDSELEYDSDGGGGDDGDGSSEVSEEGEVRDRPTVAAQPGIPQPGGQSTWDATSPAPSARIRTALTISEAYDRENNRMLTPAERADLLNNINNEAAAIARNERALANQSETDHITRNAPVPTSQIGQTRTSQNETAPANRNADAPVNLDAGGPGRWADGNYDFGEEPDDEGFAQVWSCKHEFEIYNIPLEDGINRGDLDKMECNRCFVAVQPKRTESKPSAKRRKKLAQSQSQGSKNDPILIKDDSPCPAAEEKIAWECERCKLVVCVPCRDKYASVR